MNPKVLIPALLVTHAVAGLVGFMVAKSLLAKDPEWVKENKQVETRLNDLDAAVKTTTAETVEPKAPEKKAPEPPADWKPGEATFSIHTHGMSSVSFTSDAPLESIVGTTTKVSGDFKVNLGDLAKTTTAGINVAVSTLKTGNGTRDEHLQGEGWFHTEKHPDAIFTLQGVEAESTKLWPGHTTDATLTGKLTIKGITHPVTAKATIGYHPFTPALADFGIKSNIMRIKAGFDVKLSDYEMSAAVVGKKVAETVQVSLNVTALEQAADAAE